MNPLIFRMSCPDRVGLLHESSGFFAERGFNLLEVRQFSCEQSRNFFLRLEAESPAGGFDRAELEIAIAEMSTKMGGEWSIRGTNEHRRVAILCSHEGHCLNDLLWRWRNLDMPMDLSGVISNHAELQEDTVRQGARFLHIPVENGRRTEGFRQLEETLLEWGVHTVVLARYMQIIPPEMCRRWDGRIINIHHSFLPAFAGGGAYRQAYDRGVKLIGATCHYATADLDEGPIIEQEVIRTGHHHGVADLKRIGRDCERVALARGLRYHLEDRVFREGRRTVVLGG
jgi:formyltetrahydrofolate deformylase